MERAKGFEPSTQHSEGSQARLLTNDTRAGYTQIRAQISEPTCPDLAKVVGAWSSLSQPLKAAIVAIVHSAAQEDDDR
jgi:hypothetical protein